MSNYKTGSNLMFQPSRRLTWIAGVVFVLLFLVLPVTKCTAADAAEVKVSWMFPTSNVDGTPLVDLAGILVYQGTSSRNYTKIIDIPGGTPGAVGEHTLTGLVSGTTYYLNGAAYNSARLESDFCQEVSKIATNVLISPVPPVANFVFVVTTSGNTVPVTASFDAQNSFDEDGTIVSYNWSFGDGNTGSGVVQQHTYVTPGTYQVILTVTDNLGYTDSAVATITVNQNLNLMLHVKSIAMSIVSSRSGRIATARVQIVNAYGVACSGATVSGQWSGVVSKSSSGVTGSDGMVSLSSPRTKKKGTFTFKVLDVIKTGCLYNYVSNVVTQASVP